jgi:hypothetical protein
MLPQTVLQSAPCCLLALAGVISISNPSAFLVQRVYGCSLKPFLIAAASKLQITAAPSTSKSDRHYHGT